MQSAIVFAYNLVKVNANFKKFVIPAIKSVFVFARANSTTGASVIFKRTADEYLSSAACTRLSPRAARDENSNAPTPFFTVIFLTENLLA